MPVLALLPIAWMGASGAYFWVDPTEQLVAVQMIQVVSGAGLPFNEQTARRIAEDLVADLIIDWLAAQGCTVNPMEGDVVAG